MADDDFRIAIAMRNVAQGDAIDLAQRIWDENAESFDAARGDFDIHVSRGGFDTGWQPGDDVPEPA